MLENLIARVGNLPEGTLNKPATEQEIVDFETRACLRLPDDLRAFYKRCNGMKFESCAEVMALSKVAEMREAFQNIGLVRTWCYVPLTENHDSNPICVCCEGPLKGYLVHVFHDDEPIIKWRSFENLLKETLECLNEEGVAFDDVYDDFENDARTEHDISIAHSLLQLAKKLPQDHAERVDACRFASRLLNSGHVDSVADLLDTEDEYVRRTVCNRLKLLRNAKASVRLEDYERKFSAFLESCQNLLSKEGIRTTIDSVKNFSLPDHSVSLNMDGFYTERNRPDFNDFFVGRVKHLIDSR